MSAKAQRPPAGEPWVWMTRELLSSDAWRSLSVNGRRFIDFLQLEHLGRGGRHNGDLKAPYRQLEAFGIGARFVARAISEAEKLGLVICYRGGMRIATSYALAWLPLQNGTAAPAPWRMYKNSSLTALSRPKSNYLPHQGKAALPHQGKADGSNLPHKGKADTPQNLPHKGKALLRSSYQGGGVITDLSVARRRAVAGKPTRQTDVVGR